MKLSKTLGRVGIILIGRGLAGVAHIGMLDALLELGVLELLYYLQGGSSGALMGASLSEAQTHSDLADRLEVNRRGWKLALTGPRAVFGADAVKDRLGGVDPRRLEELLKNPTSPKNLLTHRKEIYALYKSLKSIKSWSGLLKGDRLDPFIKDYNPEAALTSCIIFRATVLKVLDDETGQIKSLSVQDFRDDPEAFRQIIKVSGHLLPFLPMLQINGSLYTDARSMDVSAPELEECDTILVLFTHPKEFRVHRQTEELNGRGVPTFAGDASFVNTYLATELDKERFYRLKTMFSNKRVIDLYTPVPPTLLPLSCGPNDDDRAIEMARAATLEAWKKLKL